MKIGLLFYLANPNTFLQNAIKYVVGHVFILLSLVEHFGVIVRNIPEEKECEIYQMKT